MNINRIVNHSPLFSYKIFKAYQLKIIANGQINTLIKDYCKADITQAELIEMLSNSACMELAEYKKQLFSVIRMGMVEFHPTDICNNRCKGCIYSQSSNVYNSSRKIFPYSNLDVFKFILPKTMILVGGGEPTIYRDGKNDFISLVKKILSIVPGIRFGLVTNGIYKPSLKGLEKHFDFIRISLGAHKQELFLKNKGSDSFDKTLKNAVDYLNSSIPLVVFNFMINRETIDYCIEFARFIYHFVKKSAPDKLAKSSIQYRALIYAPNLSRVSNKSLETENMNVLSDQLETIKRKLLETEMSNEELNFIVNNTNLEDCLQGTKSHNPVHFDFCAHALLFGQIRANGDVQPCNVRSDDPVVRLGDLGSEEGLIHLAINQFNVFLKNVEDDLCEAKYCRRHGKNKCFLDNMNVIFRYPVKNESELERYKNVIQAQLQNYKQLESGIDFFF